MDVRVAKKAYSVDRLLIIGLVNLLLEKKVIRSPSDLVSLRRSCREILSNATAIRDPVIQIQVEETAIELQHFFRSFKLEPD